MLTLTTDGDIAHLDLGDDENRFSPAWVQQARDLLAEVAARPSPRALVTTAGGRFFSNGLDLEWLVAHPDEAASYVASVHALLADVLAFPAPTVAVVQGHAFAAGAMLALAHDTRVMRADRGFLCLPEVDINIPFTPFMGALIQAKLTPAAAVDAMTTGRRYGGLDALALGIVDRAVPAEELMLTALEHVRPLAGKDGTTLGLIKQRMFAPALAALADDAALVAPGLPG